MSHNRSSEKTVFVECIRNGDLEGIQKILLSRNVNLDKSNPRLKECLKERLNDFKETALHIAVKHQHERIIKWLLQCGADICATDLYLRTVLHTACDENEGTDIIALILKCKGVVVNARDENGITPVWLAAEKGNSRAVKLLMNNEANITIADKVDNTCLHVAAKTGHSDVLKLLLEKLANTRTIGKQNKDKETPLHLAVTSKNVACVAMLLNAGAVSMMDVKNEQGQTATDLAKEHGNKEIISLLEDPQKAKEHFQAKPKSVLGRGGSVETDSGNCLELTERNFKGLQTGDLSGVLSVVPVVLMANEVNLNQQIHANISGGNNTLGTQVVNAQDGAAVRPRRSVLSGDSHYHLNMTGGNAAVGDNSMINLAPGTPGTPSTTGSSNAPFFPEPQENSYTSSGFPAENPNSLRATESATRPTEEHSPGNKLDESARRPVQEAEESPGYKLNESARRPVQEAEESPGYKLNESARRPVQEAEESPGYKLNESARRPVQEAEESPGYKLNESARRPVQEESPGYKLDESSHHPVQEGHPRHPLDVSTLSRAVQEECRTNKSHVSSTSPVQEASPKDEFKESLVHPVQEEHPTDSSDVSSLSRPVQEECPRDKSHVSSTSPVQEESPMGKWNASLPYAVPVERSPRKLDGAVNGSNTEQMCASRQSMSSQTRTDDDLSLASDYRFTGESQLSSSFNGEPAVQRIEPDAVRDSSSEEAISPSGAVEPCEHSKTAMDPGSCDKAGALKGILFDGEVSKQNCQENVRQSAPRKASPMTRGVSKVAQDRFLKETSKSLTNETFSWDEMCAPLESHSAPAAGARYSSSSSSTCAPSPSGSKESSHRKAQHSREPEILHGSLPAGAGANVNETMTTARNGQASFPGNHYGDNPVGTSRDNLSSGTQSSADGSSTTIEIKDDNPDDDRKGQESCEDRCRLM